MNTIYIAKQLIIPAMTSSVITTKFNVEMHPNKTYVATIHCPGAPTLTGVPSLVSIDSNQNCKIVIDNFAPYEVTIERNDIMGIIEIKEGKIPSRTRLRPISAPLSKAIFQALPGINLLKMTSP
jgi:hypothetical protein